MTHGHFGASLDPLNLRETIGDISQTQYSHISDQLRELLDYNKYGFTEADLDRTFYVDLPQLGGILAKQKLWKLRDIIDALKKAYCGKIGVEYMHNPSITECAWIRDIFEIQQYKEIPKEKKIQMLDRLLWTDEFANFCANKFNTAKRFGIEGV